MDKTQFRGVVQKFAEQLAQEQGLIGIGEGIEINIRFRKRFVKKDGVSTGSVEELGLDDIPTALLKKYGLSRLEYFRYCFWSVGEKCSSWQDAKPTAHPFLNIPVKNKNGKKEWWTAHGFGYVRGRDLFDALAAQNITLPFFTSEQSRSLCEYEWLKDAPTLFDLEDLKTAAWLRRR